MMPGMSLIMSGLSINLLWLVHTINSASTMPDKGQSVLQIWLSSRHTPLQVVIAFMMMTMIFIIAPRSRFGQSVSNEVLDTKCRIINGSETQV